MSGGLLTVRATGHYQLTNKTCTTTNGGAATAIAIGIATDIAVGAAARSTACSAVVDACASMMTTFAHFRQRRPIISVFIS